MKDEFTYEQIQQLAELYGWCCKLRYDGCVFVYREGQYPYNGGGFPKDRYAHAAFFITHNGLLEGYYNERYDCTKQT